MSLQRQPRVLWNLKGSGLTTTLTVNGTSDVINLMDVTDVWLAVYVTGTSTGTSPTLDVQLDVQDVDGNWFPQVVKTTQLTSAPNYTSISAGLHMAGAAIVLPQFGRVAWSIGGTGSPKFPGASISLIGR